MEDNLLYQLQVLFGQLKISQKRHYETLPFCKSIREPNGAPINLGFVRPSVRAAQYPVTCRD